MASAKAGQTWMILGNLMGSVIICATLVLGIVALIYPIHITDFSPFATARFFMVVSSLFFLIFLRTDRKITRKEGIFLLLLYVSFIITEILLR
jgi:cation:H+ antiporter